MNYAVLGLAVVLVLVWLMSRRRKKMEESKASLIQDFITQNPDRVSIKLLRNGEIITDHASDRLMPLASTVKIIVAIEYAKRAADGRLDPDEIISFDQLDNFYIPKTDGGAHMAWFKSISKKISEGGISLREVAKGMIVYSSNANTEFLCDKIGLEHVNKCMLDLGMKDFTQIYHLASSLFVNLELFPDLEGEELVNALTNLSSKEYISATNTIHSKLLDDPKYKSTYTEVGFDIQKVWSDRLPASTTSEYVEVMRKLNTKSHFSPEVHTFLDELLETIMENPANAKWLKHAGMKGGSTAFALTKALYATDLEGNTTELAYFFNNLTLQESERLVRAMNTFEIQAMTNVEAIISQT